MIFRKRYGLARKKNHLKAKILVNLGPFQYLHVQPATKVVFALSLPDQTPVEEEEEEEKSPAQIIKDLPSSATECSKPLQKTSLPLLTKSST